MSMIFPNVPERTILQATVGLNSNKVKLFSNNFTVTANTVLADFTQVTGGGYAAITLSSANWGYTLGDPTVALYNQFIEFDFSGTTGGSGKVYGYYITDSAGTTLYAAENITEFTPAASTSISLSLRITCASVN